MELSRSNDAHLPIVEAARREIGVRRDGVSNVANTCEARMAEYMKPA
jgi:hypothetical protein